jgi:hypothetical protein
MPLTLPEPFSHSSRSPSLDDSGPMSASGPCGVVSMRAMAGVRNCVSGERLDLADQLADGGGAVEQCLAGGEGDVRESILEILREAQRVARRRQQREHRVEHLSRRDRSGVGERQPVEQPGIEIDVLARATVVEREGVAATAAE